MKSSSNKYYLIFAFLILPSCVEPFRPDLNKSDLEYSLVVEGKVTDECGPFRVRLSKSGEVYTYYTTNSFEPVSDADVQISDDQGNIYQLYLTENGWYQTIDTCLQGVPGNTYTLHITGRDGMQYESTPEFMAETPAIDSIYYQEEQRTRIEGEEVRNELWSDILLDTRSSGTGIQYFKWEFEETWEFSMAENIKVVKHAAGPPGCDCGIDSVFFVSVAIPPQQLHCWTSEPSRSVLVKSTATDLSGRISKFKLLSAGPEDDRFSIRYSILVKQYSISKELYNFFKQLENLNETNGGMFDKLPAPLYGNIQSLSGDKKALGYFLTSAVKTKRMFVDNKDVHVKTGHSAYSDCGYEYPPISYFPAYFYGIIVSGNKDVGAEVWSKDNYCTDCRERGTKVKPDFW